MRATVTLCLGVLVGGFLLTSCGDDTTASSSGSGASGTTANTGGASSSYDLTIAPTDVSVEVELMSPADPIAFTAVATPTTGGEGNDVTASCEWETDNPSLGAITIGMFTPGGVAGTAEVVARYGPATATAQVQIKVVGDVVIDGDPSIVDAFDAASPDPDAANAPAIEYPEDGVVLPSNLPPIETQWSAGLDNSAYRVRLEAENLLDVAFYTSQRELALPLATWETIRASTFDNPITLSVDGLGPAGQLREGAPRTLTISADSIDDSAIYVWQSSTGSFRVLDIAAGTDIALPSNAAALTPGQPCSGCHRISRDGKRFAYSFNGANFQVGTLAYDETTQSFLETLAPQAGVRGTYATFNPLEDVSGPAMLLTVPDDVAQNTAGVTRVALVHPETNMPRASNLAARLGEIALASTLMPDWSPDGSFVVMVAYDSNQHFVRELGDDVVNASIIEMPVTYLPDTQTFEFGPPVVRVAPAAGNPDTAENNFLPTVSPDGSAIAFTRASGWWSIKTQQSLINQSGQISLVRREDNTVIDLVRGSHGSDTILHSTWPQWAPTVGSRYLWLAYASQRPYGHRLTPASPENAQCLLIQGQTQCKQLWVMAVDRAELASGVIDPSRAPFWIPGQTLAAQYVSPQWTKAVAITPQ